MADGLVVSLLLGVWPGLLTEYGPAVAGRGAISGRGRNLVGLIGATESPLCETVVDSGRDLTGASEAVELVEAVEDVETVRIGEKLDMAEPGRAG